MLRSAEIIHVDDTDADGEKLVCCLVVSVNAGASSLSTVTFVGVSGHLKDSSAENTTDASKTQ
jgi:hypothetical protein